MYVRKGLRDHELSDSCLDYQIIDDVVGDAYLKILGLDQWDESGANKLPDGQLDCREAVFRPDWGLLISPGREPFNSGQVFIDKNGQASETLAVRVSDLYYYYSQAELWDASVYFMELKTRTWNGILLLGSI